jgi:hypothetical protein
MSTAQPVHPPWFDPRMPRREDCVLKAILDDRAARLPERRIALFEERNGPGVNAANMCVHRRRHCKRSALALAIAS